MWMLLDEGKTAVGGKPFTCATDEAWFPVRAVARDRLDGPNAFCRFVHEAEGGLIAVGIRLYTMIVHLFRLPWLLLPGRDMKPSALSRTVEDEILIAVAVPVHPAALTIVRSRNIPVMPSIRLDLCE